METRKLAAIMVAFHNAVAEAAEATAKDIEELISEDGDDEKEGRGSRPRDRDEDKGGKDKGGKDKGGKDKGGKGDATEKEIVSATRAALKILDEDEVLKIIKKHGDGAAKATEVEAEFRQDVIDALEEAVEDADKD